ncbi:MAG: hypothetical protein RR539_10540 [Clostridium sp.]|uniref:hypothetical protein n=1 Tax=Clostridium sp. TaxID=1506 RepID=UPI002FC792F5
MTGLKLIIEVIGALILIDLISILINRFKIRNIKFNTLYKTGYYGLMINIARTLIIYLVIDGLFFWIRLESNSIDIAYNIVIPIFVIGYYILKRSIKAKIGEEGIILPRGIFIPYSDIVRFEINITPGERAYSIKIISSAKFSEDLIIEKEFLNEFLIIAEEKTNAHISKLYEKFQVEE